MVIRRPLPEGYLGATSRIVSGPAPELIEAGYALEIADAPLLHDGLNLADLAHLIALSEAGVVPDDETAALFTVLLEWLDIPAEGFPYDPLYGDAYNSREREMERRLGPVAGWLHTGRTRREAGRIAFRLALRSRLLNVHEAVASFVTAIADLAESHASTIWADVTYLQPAQPSTFGHYLGGFGEEALRHLERLELAYRWTDRSPAGSGGVCGTRIPISRKRLAELLGFADFGAHTRDAMWATDGLVDAVLAGVQAATTIDRLAEDLEIFTSPNFGYVTLDPSLCRASVLMPQKRNPYALAVIRSGAGTLIGRVTGLLVSQRTPSARTDNWLHAYGEVAGSLDLSRRLVALGAEVVRTLTIDIDKLAIEAGSHFTGATDLAEELVLQAGINYRSSYQLVGRALADALARGQTSITVSDLNRASIALFGDTVHIDPECMADALDPASSIGTRTAVGGASPERVREQCKRLRDRVAHATSWRKEHLERASGAEDELVAIARERAGIQVGQRS
jgi:argininosuccinate lyase